MARALYSWMYDAGEQNLIRAVFLIEAARDFYPDWEQAAASVVAGLRMRADRDLEDPRLTELVGELSLKSPEFARLWSQHDVRPKRAQTKIVYHPLVGELTLAVEPLTIDSSPGQQLMIYHADPGSRSAQSLALLGSLTTPQTVPTAAREPDAAAQRR